MADDDVQSLYSASAAIQDATDKAMHVGDYRLILVGAKGSLQAKQLAAQLIPKYFSAFSSEASEEAINACLDLCEEENLSVRVTAIAGLPLLCKDTPTNVGRISDVLAQLLLTEDQVESVKVKKAIMDVIKIDVKASLEGLFTHLVTGDDALRDRVFLFLREKVFPARQALLQPAEDLEKHFAGLIKKALPRASAAEFKTLYSVLASLSIYGKSADAETLSELMDAMTAQADLETPVSALTDEAHAKVLSCLEQSGQLISRGVPAARLMSYFTQQVMPFWDAVPADRKLGYLRALARLSPFGKASDARALCSILLERLRAVAPEKAAMAPETEEGGPDPIEAAECLCYALLSLCSKAPNALNVECGFRVNTGQPSDGLHMDMAATQATQAARMDALAARAAAAAKSSQEEAQKLIAESKKAKIEAAKAAKAAAAAAATPAAPAAAAATAEGEAPAAEATEEAAAAAPAADEAAPAAAAPAADGKGKEIQALLGKAKSARVVAVLAKALTGKEPKFAATKEVRLSWLPGQGGGKGGGNKPQQQQQQSKGQQQQQQQGKGQKRQQQQQGGGGGGKKQKGGGGGGGGRGGGGGGRGGGGGGRGGGQGGGGGKRRRR